ncbi:MAG: LPS export ABC transporter periplasmic protein LptC, partial [Bacteroidales bacterium]|nr:LPS export ABC transporter periplasmic protein LptC [Bacteroidales bacterium]
GNVVAKNFENGDALYTEELFWDEKEEVIYSDSYTRVHSEENTLYGKKGFRSNQNLSNWQLIGSSGTINVKDEE